MNLEELARDAGRGIRRATERANAGDRLLERLHDAEARRLRNQRVMAGALAMTLTAVFVVAGIIVFSSDGPPTPAAGVPGGTIVYGVWDERISQADWYTAKSDGTGVRAIGITATCAAWMPDGKHLVITNDDAVSPTQPLRPAIVDADGSNLRALDATRDAALNLGCGDASPDGRRLVLEGFGRKGSGVNGIYAVSASDGGGLIRLTAGHDSYPVYSPDGEDIAFFRTKSGVQPAGAGALFVMAADDNQARRITPWDGAFLNFGWSPDGRWIVYEHPYGELYLVHRDGSGLHRVPVDLPAGTGATQPSWSPDARWIVFALKRSDAAEIWVVRPDGTGLRRLVAEPPGELSVPRWAP